MRQYLFTFCCAPAGLCPLVVMSSNTTPRLLKEMSTVAMALVLLTTTLNWFRQFAPYSIYLHQLILSVHIFLKIAPSIAPIQQIDMVFHLEWQGPHVIFADHSSEPAGNEQGSSRSLDQGTSKVRNEWKLHSRLPKYFSVCRICTNIIHTFVIGSDWEALITTTDRKGSSFWPSHPNIPLSNKDHVGCLSRP